MSWYNVYTSKDHKLIMAIAATSPEEACSMVKFLFLINQPLKAEKI